MQTCANPDSVKPFDLDEFIAAAQRAKLLYPVSREPFPVTRAELEALRRPKSKRGREALPRKSPACNPCRTVP
jgi:hypothetical protein